MKDVSIISYVKKKMNLSISSLFKHIFKTVQVFKNMIFMYRIPIHLKTFKYYIILIILVSIRY